MVSQNNRHRPSEFSNCWRQNCVKPFEPIKKPRIAGFFYGHPSLHWGSWHITWRLEQLAQRLEQQQVWRLRQQLARRLEQQQALHQLALVLERPLEQVQQAQQLLLFCRKRTEQQQR
jgi:hypothetical protein